MSAEDFLKLHWLVALAESGKHPLHFYGDGGDGADGAGGSAGGGEDEGEQGGDQVEDDEEEGQGDDVADPAEVGGYEPGDPEYGSALAELAGVDTSASDPGADPESDFDFGDVTDIGDLGAGSGASAGGFDEAGFADVTAADFGTAAEAYGYGPDVTDITAMDQAVAPDVNLGLDPEASFVEHGVAREDVAVPDMRDELAAAIAGLAAAPGQPFDQQDFNPNAPAIFQPNTNFAVEPLSATQAAQTQAQAPGYVADRDITSITGYTTNPDPTPAGPLLEAPPSPVEQPGAKEFSEQYGNPAGLVGTTPGTTTGRSDVIELPEVEVVGGRGRGGVPFDDPRGDFVGVNQGPTATGYPTSVQESKGDLYGLGPSSQQSTQAQTSPTSTSQMPGVTADINPQDYVNANFGNWDTPVETPVAQGPAVPGSREVGTTSITQDRAGNVIETPTGMAPTSFAGRFGDWNPPTEFSATQPTAPVAAPPVSTTQTANLEPLGYGREPSTRDQEWAQNERESREAAPRPDASPAPPVEREPNVAEKATQAMIDYFGGQQAAGAFDPGANATGSDDFRNPRYSTQTFENFANADPLAAAAPPVGSSLVPNQPTPSSSVNQTPYVPAQPPQGAGQYVQSGFDVAPERGYPAQRVPHNLRDAIAIALLKQTQDRLRT